MTPIRNYLVEPLIAWICDNGLTPYIIVNTAIKGVEVPNDYVEENNTITLNLSPQSTNDFTIDKELLSFKTRFKGESKNIMVPMDAILVVYAKETGQGMVFDSVNSIERTTEQEATKPVLRVVK